MPRQGTLFLYPRSVRQQVLAQHEDLRTLLFEALDQTGRCLQGQREIARLALLVLQIRRRFRAHLAFEERKLFPILAQVDLWGPERVAELSLEHARQRSQLDTLVQGMREAGACSTSPWRCAAWPPTCCSTCPRRSERA